MPTYEYKCTKCEKCTEFFHKMDHTEKDCPKCDSKGTLKKVLTSCYLNLKGEGFYSPGFKGKTTAILLYAIIVMKNG